MHSFDATCKFVILLVQPLWLRQSWISHDLILSTLQLQASIRLGRVSWVSASPNNGVTFKQTETGRNQDTTHFHILIPNASLSNPRDILPCGCIAVVVTLHFLVAMPAMLPLILAVAAVKCLAECQTEENNLLSCWGS